MTKKKNKNRNKSMAKKVASNEEVLKEILVRLPAKPLLRFKCVSKRWLALISEPRFCHSHTLRHYKYSSRSFPSALLLAPGTPPSPFRCPIFPLNASSSDSSTSTSSSSSSSSSNFRYVKVPGMIINIMQSSNGLLLVEGRPIQNPYNPLKARHFVYNPTTNHHIAVNFPTPQFRSSVLSLFLCFEPLKSPHYKIVSLRFRDNSSFSSMMNYAAATMSRNVKPDYVVNVYSSETGSWSEPGVNFSAPFGSNAIYCNGAIYWWFTNAVKYSKYFDVENQCFKKYPMPSSRILKDKILKYSGESGGHLHVVAQSILNFELDVLELSEDRSGWSVRFHLNLDSLQAAFPRLRLPDFGLIDVFCVARQENEVDSMLVFTINGRFIGCTLLDHTIRKLSCFDPFFSAGAKLDVFHYYENLSSVAPSTF